MYVFLTLILKTRNFYILKMKVAYIDYKSDPDFINRLKEKGIDLVVSDTLNQFEMNGYSLSDFQVLLFHPGINHQYEIGDVKKRYPNLALVIVTAPDSQIDYMTRKKDILIFSYNNINEIIKIIQTNK
jgi:hypothetical protein